MYFQLKWHHINLISIDATCNLIFQCMVFSSNWLHRLCKEVYCTYTQGPCATVDGYKKCICGVAHKYDCSSAWKSNSQVLNFATQIIFKSHGVYVRWLERPKVNDISKMRCCSLSNFPGKDIYFVQNKSLSSDMQVSRTQRGSFASSCRFNYWPVADSNPILRFIMIENVQTIQWLHARGGRGSTSHTSISHTLTRQKNKKEEEEKKTHSRNTPTTFNINCKSVTSQ